MVKYPDEVCSSLSLSILATLSGVVWVFRKLLQYVYWKGNEQLDDSQDYGNGPTDRK